MTFKTQTLPTPLATPLATSLADPQPNTIRPRLAGRGASDASGARGLDPQIHAEVLADLQWLEQESPLWTPVRERWQSLEADQLPQERAEALGALKAALREAGLRAPRGFDGLQHPVLGACAAGGGVELTIGQARVAVSAESLRSGLQTLRAGQRAVIRGEQGAALQLAWCADGDLALRAHKAPGQGSGPALGAPALDAEVPRLEGQLLLRQLGRALD